MYLEKLIERARHVEVQLIGDDHGNLVHLFERDCSIQRRNQKVVERAPAPYLSQQVRDDLTGAAIRLGKAANYRGAGTVEFLLDADTGQVLLHRGEPAHPGRAHGDRSRHRHRHRQGADPVARGRGASARRRVRACRIQRRHPAQRPRASSAASPPKIPSTTSFPTTAASPPIAARRASASASTAARPMPGAVITRCLRSAARKGHRLGADRRRKRSRAWTARCASSASAASQTNLAVPRKRHHASGLPREPLHDALHRYDAGAVRHSAAAATARPSSSPTSPTSPSTAIPKCATGRGRRPMRWSPCRRAYPPLTIVAGTPSSCSTRSGPKDLARMDAGREAGARSPTPRCATRTSRCWRRACAPTTSRASPTPIRAACRNCSRSNAGAARRSTSPCASSTRIRGSGLRAIRERRAEHPHADAAARCQRRRLHQLSRQCGQVLRRQAAAGGIDVFRVFDCLNWVENMRVSIDAVLEAGKRRRGRNLLHRRYPRSGPGQIRPQILRRDWPRSWRRPARIFSASRTWRAC